MKALTICQPYAHLIMLPRSDPRHKRVENRGWFTTYRGPLLIHAGKSREFLEAGEPIGDDPADAPNYGIALEDMAFGAIIGRTRLLDCLHIDDIDRGRYDTRFPWLRTHQHTEGDYCWILDDPVPVGPWEWRGAQGLWTVDDAELERAATRQIGLL